MTVNSLCSEFKFKPMRQTGCKSHSNEEYRATDTTQGENESHSVVSDSL